MECALLFSKLDQIVILYSIVFFWHNNELPRCWMLPPSVHA